VLWLGGALGVLAIPLYALGYCAAARMLLDKGETPGAAGAARIVGIAGSVAAIVGAMIHGLTTAYLASEVTAGAPGRDPLAAITQGSPLLVASWAVAVALVSCASVAFAWCVGRGGSRLPKRLAWTNPALVTVLLMLIGLPVPLLRAFLTPAAPNLAHAVFFAALARRRPDD